MKDTKKDAVHYVYDACRAYDDDTLFHDQLNFMPDKLSEKDSSFMIGKFKVTILIPQNSKD